LHKYLKDYSESLSSFWENFIDSTFLMSFMIALSDTPIDVEKIIAEVSAAEAGAIDIFIGTVRNHNEGRKVTHLAYEAYVPMALREMEKIARTAKRQWPVKKLALIHRTGKLSIGEIAVVVAVATPHRKEAFEACRYVIDALKATVPIWKKEYFEGGELWIEAHP
jgi:molybdopterin synthase catalytic subunit